MLLTNTTFTTYETSLDIKQLIHFTYKLEATENLLCDIEALKERSGANELSAFYLDEKLG